MIKQLILNKHLLTALLFLTIQQAIAASSTYFIALLAQSLTEEKFSILYMVLFIASLFAVYIPAYFYTTNMTATTYDAHKLYNDKFHESFLGKAYLLSSTEIQNTARSTLAQESKYTLSTLITGIFDIVSLLLNVIFNLTVLTWFLDSRLLLGYALGLTVASIFIYLIRNKLRLSAQLDQESRLDLTSKLFESWDNVVIFNKLNYSIYNSTVQNSFITAKYNSIKSESIRQISSSFGMFLMMLPVFIAVTIIFKDNWQNTAILAVVVATLPRQIQLLQMCYQLINYQTDISIINTMLKGILDILQPDSIDLTKYIQLKQICIKQTGSTFDPEVLPLVGSNGVGKSSILLKLKYHYQKQAYYLPANHHLYFDYHKEYAHKGSTGQQLIRQIEEIKEKDQSLIIMLDEWDANLDSKNIEIIDHYLDSLAQTKLVIDIRH